MKNITKKLLLVIQVFICSIFFIGCAKKDNTINDIGNTYNKPDGIMAYYKFGTEKSNGIFSVKQFTSLANQDNARATQAGGFFVENNKAVPKGNVQIGDLVFAPDYNANYMYGLKGVQGENLYGQKIACKYNIQTTTTTSSSGSNDGSNVADSIYLPQKISLLQPAYSNNMSITNGTEVKWNIDLKNEKGVVVVLEYDPKWVLNSSFSSSFPNRVIKATTLTEAQGNFIFNTAFLQNFPNNVNVKLTVGRANYKTIDAGTAGNYAMYAYTVVENYFKMVK